MLMLSGTRIKIVWKLILYMTNIGYNLRYALSIYCYGTTMLIQKESQLIKMDLKSFKIDLQSFKIDLQSFKIDLKSVKKYLKSI